MLFHSLRRSHDRERGKILGSEIYAAVQPLHDGLKEPALRRHGETDDKTEELI